MSERDTSGPGLRILHAFADHGVESEVLACYGDVVRVGHAARETNDSQPVRAKVERLPFDGEAFDFGLFHPPCTAWSDMPDANKDGDAPDLIPEARAAARRHCRTWVIENKPRAPLDDPVLLDGDMFGLPIEYQRAFEANFALPQPPRQGTLVPNESSSYFYSEKSRGWWASVKGVDADRYTKHALCKNSLPAAYVHYLVRHALVALDEARGPSDYSEYDKRKAAERSRATNHTLEEVVR